MDLVILANPLKVGDLLVASRQIDEGIFYESVVYLIDVALDGVLGAVSYTHLTLPTILLV